MAASLLIPTLRTAPALSPPRCGSREITHPRNEASTARRARSRPCRVRATTTLQAEDAAGDNGATKQLSAFTSVRQERWQGDLAVDGRLPLWLNGTYIRNGPGMWDVGEEHAFHHLFDGYATLVRISFRRGRATGAHRQIESEAYKAARARGRPLLREFSHCPAPANLLDRLGNLVGLVTGAALTDNPNSAVLPLGDGRVMCLTETTKSSVLIDPDTLETLERFRYTDRLGGMVQSAHPIVTESEFLTLLPDLARPGHLVVRMEAGSNERKAIGRVDCRGGPSPGWLHSFAVTEKYVVVPEMPLRYSSASLLKSELAEFYAFEWLPASGSYMHVMCKSTGKTVASVEVPPFMAIHFINAYEEEADDVPGGRPAAVVVDCCEHYGDPAIIEALVLNRLRSFRDKDVLPNARVGRFRIPLDGSPFGELETALDPEEHGRGMDMCSINPVWLGRRYRYVYACGACRPCNFPNMLTKVDLVEKATNWHEKGSVPSEPFFVARPGATDEDDGQLNLCLNFLAKLMCVAGCN
ncbi:hypothetical protein E2562_023149 [Oryza meyeriana var. granulata]|uniref:Uncharacterized protein n=2 Tax=Oryza meyeriana var. granulata TaxID=110450 RepID=A0A6G1E0J6_9ORYZ|nr:hypothetical protein E2562_023149 [Oryza meyeriana var. granulata]